MCVYYKQAHDIQYNIVKRCERKGDEDVYVCIVMLQRLNSMSLLTAAFLIINL